MKITKSLHLVIPVEGDGEVLNVHASAISYEIFEKFWFVISKAFDTLIKNDLTYTAAPKVAALCLRETAKNLGQEDDVDKILIPEIVRLTNVAIIGEKGVDTLPYYDAVSSGRVSMESAKEVENAIVFFTLACSMFRKIEKEIVIPGAMSLWGGRCTSLSFTDFVSSLQQSISAASSGATTPAVSSAPC